MKITNVDRPTLRIMQDIIGKHMAAAALEMGMTVKYVGGSFDPRMFTPKYEFGVTDVAGVDARGKHLFETYADTYGLKKEWYGQEFISRGRPLKIVGIATSRPKYAIECQDRSGHRVFCPPQSVKFGMMGRAA